MLVVAAEFRGGIIMRSKISRYSAMGRSIRCFHLRSRSRHGESRHNLFLHGQPLHLLSYRLFRLMQPYLHTESECCRGRGKIWDQYDGGHNARFRYLRDLLERSICSTWFFTMSLLLNLFRVTFRLAH
jgi:hypothetical protein